jgi:hypothetical protein
MKMIAFILCLSCSALAMAQEKPCSGKTYYSLEEALKEPDSVKVLDIAMQDPKLTALPAEIGLLVNLECLDVSYNRISTLPTEFSKLQKLQKLNLSGNHYMANFPEVLKELPNLVEVDLTEKPEWSKEKCDAAKAALPNATIITDK